MKKVWIILCAALLLSFGMPRQAHAEEEYSVTELAGTATITAESLNVRDGPSKNYPALGKAKSGETYTITGKASTGWYRIEYKGQEGYISDQYAAVTEKAEAAEETEPREEDGASKKPFDIARFGGWITGIVIAVIIVAILISMFFTVKKMIAGDEYEDEEDEDEPEEALTEEVPEDEPREEPAEEDYRVYIDPRYFEEDKPKRETQKEKTDLELEEAMLKLNELQLEIERLKDKKK